MWYIFDENNKCITCIDYEPDCLDLESRKEYSISSEYDYEDYKNLIYKDGQIVEKPVYVPTAEEIQEQERAKLDAEYAKLFANKDSEIINAVVLMQDDEYAEQLRQERTALTQEYLTKRGAL